VSPAAAIAAIMIIDINIDMNPKISRPAIVARVILIKSFILRIFNDF
jgi:hypothetical protein